MKYFGSKWFLVLSLAGLIISMTWIYLGNGKDSILIYQKDLQRHLERQEGKVLGYLQDSSFMSYLLKRDEVRYLKDIEQQLQQLEKLQNESFSFFLTKGQNFPLVQSNLSLDKPTLAAMRSSQIKENWYFEDGVTYLLKSYQIEADVEAWAWIPALSLPLNSSLSLSMEEDGQALDLNGYPPIQVSGPKKMLKNGRLLFFVIFFLLASWLLVHHHLTVLFEAAKYNNFLLLLLGTFCTLLLVSFGIARWNAQQIFGIEWSIWKP
ncbi:MAG: hypothetical protein AAF705_11505, partial [Bacteroidota bacterium]